MAEDLELGRGEAHPSVAALDTPPLEVDQEVAVPDDPAAHRVRQVAIRPAEEGLDPAHQLAQAERLRQVVVGAELEADHLVDLVVAGGEDEDRHLGAGRPDAAQDLEAVDAGEPDVEDDQVGRLVGRDVEALLARARDGDLVAFLLERVLDPARDRVLVFDDEDGGCHAADATPARRRRPGAVRADGEGWSGSPSAMWRAGEG